MDNKEKAQLLKDIIISKEKIDKALTLNSKKAITFEECMTMIDKGNNKLSNALNAYDTMLEEDREKKLHKQYNEVD